MVCISVLAESPNEPTHAIELTDPFNAIHLLIIALQLSSVTSYFDVYTPNIAEYEDEDIPKIHLTAEEPPWVQSTNEYSKRETWMQDHQDQNKIPVTVARGPVYVSPVISYSLTYDAIDDIDKNNLATTLSAQIQISKVLIGMVRKP